jgi:hypothetical protein
MDNPKEKITEFLNNASSNFTIITFVVIFIILLSIFTWLFNTLSLKDNACNKMDSIYNELTFKYRGKTFIMNNNILIDESTTYNTLNNNITTVSDINTDGEKTYDNSKNAFFINYNVKAAYNCCCGDGYKNNFVNDCALEKCIFAGARFLDFEIYSLNNEPIIAASTANNNSIKETYNYLEMGKILEYIAKNAFFNESTEAADDPLILHFRFMSTNKIIYDKTAKYLNEYLADYLWPYTCNRDNYDADNILLRKIKYFSRRVILIVNCYPGINLRDTKLYELTNMESGSNYCPLLRYNTIEAMGTSNLLKNESKNKYIIVLPDINNDKNNFDIINPISNGCQVIAMKFQTLDSQLIAYFKQFKKNGSYNFIIKNSNVRYEKNPSPTYDNGVSINPNEYVIKI